MEFYSPQASLSSLREERYASNDAPLGIGNGTGYQNSQDGRLIRNPRRQSTLRSEPNTHYPEPFPAISPPYNNTNHPHHDVPPNFVNVSAPQHVAHPATLESTLSSTPFPHHVSLLNNYSPHHPTSTVSPDLQALAAQHELPFRLPAPPKLQQPRSIPSRAPAAPAPTTTNTLVSNYLNMLSQTEPSHSEEMAYAEDALWASPSEMPQGVFDVFSPALHEPYRTPELDFSPQFTPGNEFLTSPYGSDTSSLFEDVLFTPDVGPGDDHFEIAEGQSPVIPDYSLFNEFSTESLFPTPSHAQKPAYVAPSAPSATISPSLAQLEGLLSMSPATPQLGAFASPNMTPITSMGPPATGRRKSSATGTRKNVTPEKLLSVDAPTQPRKYVTPSSTSRKELPAVFAKKRSRSAAFGDDDLDVHALPPDASEEDQIAAKRRQNTVAARRSRKRKLETQQQQEDLIQSLTAEVAMWKGRTERCVAVMQSHNIQPPTL